MSDRLLHDPDDLPWYMGEVEVVPAHEAPGAPDGMLVLRPIYAPAGELARRITQAVLPIAKERWPDAPVDVVVNEPYYDDLYGWRVACVVTVGGLQFAISHVRADEAADRVVAWLSTQLPAP